jgi:pyridoxamine 5'-phosphate oxidase
MRFKSALPEPLPLDPLPLVKSWLDEAQKEIRNATAMALATVETDGRPGARMTICRGFDPAAGWLVFYTDRESDKGAALAKHPWAACVFHWDAFERQVRFEGPVTLAPDADSDAYWNSRPPDARIAASASLQSQPLRARADLLARIEELTKQHAGGTIPRPPRWGGYRVWAERVELWVGQPARVHDRARWTRTLTPEGVRGSSVAGPPTPTADGFKGGAWSATRLQP